MLLKLLFPLDRCPYSSCFRSSSSSSSCLITQSWILFTLNLFCLAKEPNLYPLCITGVLKIVRYHDLGRFRGQCSTFTLTKNPCDFFSSRIHHHDNDCSFSPSCCGSLLLETLTLFYYPFIIRFSFWTTEKKYKSWGYCNNAVTVFMKEDLVTAFMRTPLWTVVRMHDAWWDLLVFNNYKCFNKITFS